MSYESAVVLALLIYGLPMQPSQNDTLIDSIDAKLKAAPLGLLNSSESKAIVDLSLSKLHDDFVKNFSPKLKSKVYSALINTPTISSGAASAAFLSYAFWKLKKKDCRRSIRALVSGGLGIGIGAWTTRNIGRSLMMQDDPDLEWLRQMLSEKEYESAALELRREKIRRILTTALERDLAFRLPTNINFSVEMHFEIPKDLWEGLPSSTVVRFTHSDSKLVFDRGFKIMSLRSGFVVIENL